MLIQWSIVITSENRGTPSTVARIYRKYLSSSRSTYHLVLGLFVRLMCSPTYSNDPQLKKRMDAVKTHALSDLKQYGQGDAPR